ncbi:glycosyltransferase family A protein [Tersicoccus sp. Bi-70]|uniref:glycosyltransferase family A protein n=1 Tax=Tersicoccus sp. Bi-70 TaxID=1897634 RepID=UPI00097766CC|nr:glycosyltransferase family A protein [Tersicoccus sp. Bi-70]OMH37002.1 glycosyl transferase family 2 [Tersicoccus sp. Bi-70]
MADLKRADPLTVSVVIPVKDDAVALAVCLHALALQSRRADEIVVIDNNSTDDSAEIARRAGARVLPCRAPGIPAASATGYDAATGDLILRLDADCLPAPTWIATMVDAFAAHPEVAAFTGPARFIDGPPSLRTSLAVVYLGAYALASIPALGHLPLFGSNLGMRRAAWRDIRDTVHRDDPLLHDDLDLAFHLGERHRIRYLPTASMGMSMRPFFSGRAFAHRLRRGMRTVVVHWPQDRQPARSLRSLRQRGNELAGSHRAAPTT